MKAGRIKSPRDLNAKRKEKKFNFGRFLYWIAFLAFLGGVIYTLFFSRYLEITKIEIQGTKDLKNEALEEKVESEIGGKYLNFIPKNNLILFRKSKIAEALMDKFKRIESVEIKKGFPDAIKIFINERSSLLVFCSSNSCFIIDQKGIAYNTADFESDELKENPLTILTDESGKPVALGQKVLEIDNLDYVLDIKDRLSSEFGLEIEKDMSTPSRASTDIRIKTKEGWMIYFGSDISLDKELEMLKVVLDEKIGQDQRGNLEYVDLRSDNKVYYKLKDGAQNNAEIKQDVPENQNENGTVKSDSKKKDKKKNG